MQVYYGLENFKRLNFGVVTSGTFDGVHFGHQKILARLQEISRALGGETVVITFWPHPRLVLAKAGENDLKLLSTIAEKIELIAQQGINHLVILPFTKEFAQMLPDEYVRKVYMEAIGTKRLVIGYDHRFGKNREGGLEYLLANEAKYDFEVEEISRQDIDDVGVSSTKIRQALLAGNVKMASQHLGRAYTISGKVAHGDKLGRKIGFPTANIEIPEEYKLIPSDGIYAVKARLNAQNLQGMLYIGNRPTLKGEQPKRIEMNIFDFAADIYGQTLEVTFVDKIREDVAFENVEQMRQQLYQDGENARAMLQNSNE
ncbi:MAG: bifunctional riboflavin kinase/FAD synthetase [Microscillaceae bacterium]|jgi:riboflavin kinase/FMN adenylyltransferase|nr:bifunctional riboflavin kinase/FAD synthetase [Microscillaceae bacterium]